MKLSGCGHSRLLIPTGFKASSTKRLIAEVCSSFPGEQNQRGPGLSVGRLLCTATRPPAPTSGTLSHLRKM